MINPAGGIVYHTRALRYRNTLWRAFREETHQWLSEWNPAEQDLLIVGSSGGYCLQPDFLSRFRSITALDPDPLTRFILRKRFARSFEWDREDYFFSKRGHLSPVGIEKMVRRYPSHAILFSNFLGQLRCLDNLLDKPERFADWKVTFRECLERAGSWASFHDRLSGNLEPLISASNSSSSDLVTDSGLVDRFYPSSTRASGTQTHELLDHLTGDLFPGFARRFLKWELTPGRFHLIEAVHSNGSAQQLGKKLSAESASREVSSLG